MDRVRPWLTPIPEPKPGALKKRALESLARKLRFPGCRIDGIVLHWTAGAYGLNSTEEGAYNFVVQPDGEIQQGQFTLDKQTPPLVDNPRSYAAHVRGFNSFRAGVALDAMGGAQEKPFNAGRWPITTAQLDRASFLCAAILKFYGLELSRNTVCTHSEVPIIHGRPQPGKWDINWLPGMASTSAPLVAGDLIRLRIREHMG